MTFNFRQNIPFSLYIHIPWCVRKCPYCDFNSHALKQTLPEQEYINALIQDLEQDLAKVWGRSISSIFIGGGTPSLVSPQTIDKLLMAIASRLRLSPNAEISLEANPGTLEQNKFKGFRAAGINRLSIGVQTFQDNKLQTLGRIHSSEVAKQAIAATYQSGFANFNIDLMYGLPEQNVKQAMDDLKTAVALKPPHLSWYQLTLEPHTAFFQQPPPLPDEDLIWQMQKTGQNFLAKHGYENYEISAYCQPKHQCKHNLNYWQFGDYLGIGAGAHSKITDMGTQTVTRYWKTKHPKDYLNPDKPFIAGQKQISEQEMPLEFMMNALRLNQKIPISLFAERAGLTFATIKDKITTAQKEDLLTMNNETIETTKKGKRYLNILLQSFLQGDDLNI